MFLNKESRYKLNLLVFDGTATTTFVVFDKEAAALFGRTCTEMVKELNIELPLLFMPPDELIQLHTGGDQRSIHFLKIIRTFNSIFYFTSMAEKIDRGVNNGTAPPIFKPGVKTTVALVAYFLRIVCDQHCPTIYL
ncbi:hypothetical protein AHAS_Ahas16G0080400 [Arachis hypogaea]